MVNFTARLLCAVSAIISLQGCHQLTAEELKEKVVGRREEVDGINETLQFNANGTVRMLCPSGFVGGNTTWTRIAPFSTCALVMMYPSGSMTNPDPLPRCRPWRQRFRALRQPRAHRPSRRSARCWGKLFWPAHPRRRRRGSPILRPRVSEQKCRTR